MASTSILKSPFKDISWCLLKTFITYSRIQAVVSLPMGIDETTMDSSFWFRITKLPSSFISIRLAISRMMFSNIFMSPFTKACRQHTTFTSSEYTATTYSTTSLTTTACPPTADPKSSSDPLSQSLSAASGPSVMVLFLNRIERALEEAALRAAESGETEAGPPTEASVETPETAQMPPMMRCNTMQ
ncbi:unnamed protein product [Mytilus edulis]|uniref:Uncharacterized protein n=1 Tax=Mytilus edulis TaxID=6550 RepID=A0A8S3SL71_MYTED|nr:unnamed protein product [Mytilus edulis]